MHENKLLLERYSSGEIDEENSRRVEEHCKTCMECSGYLETLANQRRQFLSLHPFFRLQQAAAQARKQPWNMPIFNTLRRPALFPAYGLIVILCMLSPIVYFKGIRHPATTEIVFKGGDGLSFLLKRKGRISVCTPRDVVYPGDEIQVLYSVSMSGYLSLLSVDSRGALSWYNPDRKNPFCSIPVKSGRNQSYPSGILLDNSQGPELIIGLFSPAPLSTESVNAWVRGALKKTNADLLALRRELDSTGKRLSALPRTALFQKGN